MELYRKQLVVEHAHTIMASTTGYIINTRGDTTIKKLTITIHTKAKRVQEFIRVLQPLVQIGETIEHQIEDVEPEKKQEIGDKLHKKVAKR